MVSRVSEDRRLKEIIFWQREAERWSRSLDSGYMEVVGELYGEQFAKEEYLRKHAKLREVFILSQAILRFAVWESKNLFEGVDLRPRWDRYLTALHHLWPRFRRGWVVRSVLHLMKLGGVSDRIAAYSTELSRVNQTLHSMFKTADQYIFNWERGENIMQRVGRKPQEQLVQLYASYKTFPEDNRLEAFRSNLEQAYSQTITVIVEDGIKLFLMIAEDFAEIVVRLPLLERMEEFEDEDRDRQLVESDLKSWLTTLAGYLRDSEHRQLLSRIWRRTSEHAVKSWHEEECLLRAQHPQETRRRFIEQFEQGLIL
jgi:hypothetical protein